MKSALILTAFSALATAVHGSGVDNVVPRDAATDGYLQLSSGYASFTNSSGCAAPACGIPATGFTAAMNQLSYGAPPGAGPGDACGRCFLLSGLQDPYSPDYLGPFNSVVVKVTDLCAADDHNKKWCGQTPSNPINTFNQTVHFDLCPGGDKAFFPPGHNALTGMYQEVSCEGWAGVDGKSLWKGACLAGSSADFWPAVGCGNQNATS